VTAEAKRLHTILPPGKAVRCGAAGIGLPNAEEQIPATE